MMFALVGDKIEFTFICNRMIIYHGLCRCSERSFLLTKFYIISKCKIYGNVCTYVDSDSVKVCVNNNSFFLFSFYLIVIIP